MTYNEFAVPTKQHQERAAAVDVILRVAAAQSADPATDDLTVPLAIENAELARDLRLQLGYAERDKAKIERLQAAMRGACDLLAERKQGSAARSPAHNARLLLEGALADEQSPAETKTKPA